MPKQKLLAKDSSANAREDIRKRLNRVYDRVEKAGDKGLLPEKYYEKKAESLRKKVKGLRFFSWLFKKHTKTGRFGRKKAADRQDAVQALDTSEDTSQFFNPFAAINTDDAETQPGSLTGAFAQRVQEEMDLADASDFERSRFTADEDEFMLLHMTVDPEGSHMRAVDVEEFYTKGHKATEDYETDSGVVETETPDTFELALSVMRPPELYLEYTQAKTAEKRKKLGGKIDEKPMLIRLLQNNDRFQRLVDQERRWQADYDPMKDQNPDSPVNKLLAQTKADMKEVGHSFVRLITQKDGRDLNSYSFGFWPTSVAFMGGVTEGQVRNPDPDREDPRNIAMHYPIRYSDYLRAAARVRGIRGSRRTYSFTGYNCTSFAVEVAQAAGVSIEDHDSAVDITTMASRSQRVEMPAVLQRFIERELEEKKENRNAMLAKLTAIPMFQRLYEGWEGGIPQYIQEQFLDALQQAMNRTSNENLQGVAGFRYNREQGNIRKQFMDFALGSEAGLTAAMGLGVKIPEFTDFRYDVLLSNFDKWDNELYLRIAANRAYRARYVDMLTGEMDQRAILFIKDALLGKVQRIVDEIQADLPMENEITSVDQAMALKDRAAQRRARFMDRLGTQDIRSYMLRACESTEEINRLIQEVRNRTAIVPQRGRQEEPAHAARDRNRMAELKGYLESSLTEYEVDCADEMMGLNFRLQRLGTGVPDRYWSVEGMVKFLVKFAAKEKMIEDLLLSTIGGVPMMTWQTVQLVLDTYVRGLPDETVAQVVQTM